MESTAKTNLWMEEEKDEQLIECRLLPAPVLEDDPLQLAPPLIVDPLHSAVETVRITRSSTRISKIASPSKSVGESSSVKAVPKTEPDEDENALKEESDEDLGDSSAVSTKVRIIQACTELLEEDEKRKQRDKIAENKRRRERENERRRKKGENESAAKKEERLKKEMLEGKGERIRKPPKLLSEDEKKRRRELFNEQRRQKRANESEAEKEKRLKKARRFRRERRLPKIEHIEGEIVPKEEYDQDCCDSVAVSTKVTVRIIQTSTEIPEEDERKKRCGKIVSEAEKKRLERDNERRRKKRANESAAEKEKRLKKERERRERIRKQRENETEAEREERLKTEREGTEKGLEKVSDAERKKLLRNKANAERRRQKRENESEAEKEERLKKRQERIRKRKENETEAEREERLTKHRERKRSRRAQELQQLSEEEKKERYRQLKQESFFRWEAKKATMTPEEIEQAEFQKKMKIYMTKVAWKASLTPEQKKRMGEARRQRQKEYFANVPEEKRKEKIEKRRAYHKSLPVEKIREYGRRALPKYFKKLRETNPAKYKKILDNVKESNRRKTATETAEQRHKRLLRCKVNQAKRKARTKMEEEGVSPDEIERRLEEVVREVEEKDRLERARNPVNPADYKPRESARKPWKRTCAKVTALQPPELESKTAVPPQLVPCHSSLLVSGAPISDACLSTPAPEKSTHFDTISCKKVEQNDTRVEDENTQEFSENIPESSALDDNNYDDGDEPIEADYFSEPSTPTDYHQPTSPLDNSEDTHHVITERVFPSATPTQDEICENDFEPNPLSGSQNSVAEAAIPHLDLAASINEHPEQVLPTTIEKEQIREEESPPSPLQSSLSPLPTAIENEKVEEVDRVICDECGKLLRPMSVKFHKFTYHNPNRADYKCPKCDRKFITAATLWDHYLNFHEETLTSEQGESSFVKLKRGRSSSTVPNEKQQEKKNPNNSKIGPFICEQCGNKYTQKAQMDAHVRRVHLNQRFICDVCGKEEQSGGKLWKHKIANHPEIETPAPEGMIVCEYCSEPVLRSHEFHVKKYHPEKYDEFVKTAPKEKKVYSYTKGKKVRLSDVIRSKKTKCPECDQQIRLDSIQRHLRNVHGHGTNSFPCKQCNKVFKQNYSLNEHIRNVHTLNSFDRKVKEMELIQEKKDEDGELIYSCSICDERLFQRKDMGGHLLASHFDLYEKLKQPGDDAELENNRVGHKGRTPAASSQNKLKKTENNEPVNCDECGKSMHPKTLRRHKHLVHNQSGESNKCPKCEVCFASPKTLWDHYHNVCSIEDTVASLEELESRRLLERVKFGIAKVPIGKEEEEKGCRDGPFKCEHCGSEYTQKATRDAHVRRIHMNQRFICDICDKEEPTGGKLWRHKVTSHPEVETPALEGMVVCEYCSKPVLRNYQQHVEKFHPKKLAEFKKKGSYIQTKKGNSGRTMTKCPECEKEIRADRLRRHLKNVHGHGLELRPCQYCKKDFKTNSDLNDHTRTMHTFESFYTKVEAMKLIKQTPNDKGRLSLSCSLCDKNLFYRKDIGGHLLSAHFEVYEQLKKTEYEGLWKCGECSEAFDTEQLFSSHVQTSHPSTTFYCSQLGCQKLFTSRYFLKDHHRKQHPHTKCKIPLLNVDVEAPVPLPGFQCSRCDAKFIQKPKLVEHVRSEHPGNYWPCQHCDLFGYSEQVLKNHLPKCDKNPDKQVLVVKIEKDAKKKCLQKNISKKKRLREESETEEETESDEEEEDDDDDTKRRRSPVETGTRRSSRIKIKQDKKRGKKLKAKVAQGSLDDDKLNMEVKVRVERLRKEQINFYMSTKYP